MTSFFPSGKLKECFLAADQEIQGVPCVHGGFFSELFGGSAATQFYENGGLRSCRLARAATVAASGSRAVRGWSWMRAVGDASCLRRRLPGSPYCHLLADRPGKYSEAGK